MKTRYIWGQPVLHMQNMDIPKVYTKSVFTAVSAMTLKDVKANVGDICDTTDSNDRI